jgi:hypothetical protein
VLVDHRSNVVRAEAPFCEQRSNNSRTTPEQNLFFMAWRFEKTALFEQSAK